MSLAIPIIDEQDIGLLTEFNFFPVYDSGPGYVQVYSYAEKRQMLLHRVITGAKPGQKVDHINRVRHDCRRANLRIATDSQNTFNSTKREGTTSIYRGVTLDRRGRWIANYRERHVGSFALEEDAARAYDTAVIADGNTSFVPLNFPEEQQCPR